MCLVWPRDKGVPQWIRLGGGRDVTGNLLPTLHSRLTSVNSYEYGYEEVCEYSENKQRLIRKADEILQYKVIYFSTILLIRKHLLMFIK